MILLTAMSVSGIPPPLRCEISSFGTRTSHQVKYWSTPELTAPGITNVLLNKGGKTGIYYDEKGHPMQGSALVRDPQFRARVVAETRALLAENSK